MDYYIIKYGVILSDQLSDGHLGQIEFFCFPSQRASLFKSASRKFLFFISLDLMYLALELIVFR